ncbi:MAG TPA: MFS transporter, partial [Pelomicrobium sp.]|nr:MFS transporter [Pelomicrobium sp.]
MQTTKERRRSVQRSSIPLAIFAGAVVLALALGERHGFGLFLHPIVADRDWSRTSFAFAIALQNLVWGIAQPFTGILADKFGSPRVLVAGLIAYALGLALMPLSASPAAFAVSAGVLIGLGLSGTGFAIVYGAISRIVPVHSRGTALGLAGAAGSFGQFLMMPANQGLISSLGWPHALFAGAVAMIAALPLAKLLADRGAVHTDAGPALPLRAALAEAFAHRGFVLLGAGFLVCGFQLAFIATHLPAYLADHNLPAHVGAASLAIIALANVAGTYFWGALGDRRRKKNSLAVLYTARSAAIALFVLLPLTPVSTYAFSAVMGFLWLGTAPLTNGLVSQIFGVRYIATLFGVVFFAHQVGSFLGVWLGGLLFDATGSYDAVWLMTLATGLLAALI